MLSSGIYLDGAYGTYVRGNHIAGNRKEGICLDHGTTAAVVYGNDIVANGRRWGSQDHVLERDFVLRFGRMEDGTATAKVPGISMDNAMYNVIRRSRSGSPMVERAAFNRVGQQGTVTPGPPARRSRIRGGTRIWCAAAPGPEPRVIGATPGHACSGRSAP